MLWFNIRRTSTLRERLTTFALGDKFTIELGKLSLNLTLHGFRLWQANLIWVVGRLKREGELFFRYRFKILFVMFMGLIALVEGASDGATINAYIWQTTISTPANLWFVNVDKDPGMTEGTTTAITSYTFLVHPSDRLLVNKVYCRIWSWLHT